MDKSGAKLIYLCKNIVQFIKLVFGLAKIKNELQEFKDELKENAETLKIMRLEIKKIEIQLLMCMLKIYAEENGDEVYKIPGLSKFNPSDRIHNWIFSIIGKI